MTWTVSEWVPSHYHPAMGVQLTFQYLIETQDLSANVKDSNSYTPMHAAASYAHLELLEYLLSVGGDINLRDDDGDTPLYVVESVDTARWMVDHGADPSLANDEGLSVGSLHIVVVGLRT